MSHNMMAQHYDVPKPYQGYAPSANAIYDSPRPQIAHSVGLPPKSLIKGIRGGPTGVCTSASILRPVESDCGQYDVPKPLQEQTNINVPASSDRSSGVSIMSCDSTSSSASSLPASESPYLSSIGGSSNRSSLEVQDVYDVPPEPRKVCFQQRPRLPPRENRTAAENHDNPSSRTCSEGVYDVPPQVSRDARPSDVITTANQRISSGSDCSCGEIETGPGLPLEYDSATDMLAKLQQDVQCTLEKLANFNAVTSPSNKPVSEERFQESSKIIDRLIQTLREFIKFSDGSKVNTFKHGNEKLANTLQKKIEPVSSTYDIICNTWNSARANREQAIEVAQQLDDIAKSLADNVRHVTLLIKTNATFIFRKTPPVEKMKNIVDADKTPVQEFSKNDIANKKTSEVENLYANETAFLDDYDYVKLESRESVEREHQQIKESLPTNLRQSYDNLVKQSHSLVDNDHQKAISTNINATTSTTKTSTSRLDANDKQVLAFYANQAEVHIQHLNNAIDAFFLTIEENQPPKVFIAHSKFVILSAHKLVFIGDTVHRNTVNNDVRTCVLNCSNALCDAMKNTVAAAKTAAIQFPSVSAVQAMVDSFATISLLACNLRNAVCRV